MHLLGQTPVGGLDLVLARAARQTEHLIGIAHAHAPVSRSLPGRRFSVDFMCVTRPTPSPIIARMRPHEARIRRGGRELSGAATMKRPAGGRPAGLEAETEGAR